MADVNDDITITSATVGPEEIRRQLGVPEPEPTPEERATLEAQDDAQTDEGDEGDAQTETGERPKPTAASEAGRVLQAAKRDAGRKVRIQEDIDLYAQNIAALGGKVPEAKAEDYGGSRQKEIDALTRRRYDLNRQLNGLLKAKPAPRVDAPRPVAPPAQPRAATPPADGTAAPAKPTAPPAPVFKFASWDEYQEQHPEAQYDDYRDAREDARSDFRRATEDRAAREARYTAGIQQALTQHHEAADAFKAATPDFDEKTSAIKVNNTLPSYQALQMSILRAGADGPKILYYLANNPELVQRLEASPSREAFIETFTEARIAALRPTGSTSVAVAAPAAVPKNTAPAPLTPVAGGATTARSLKALAETDDDADAYIAERSRQLRPQGLRRTG